MTIKDLYNATYRKYKQYATSHRIEVKIKPVKRPTSASIRRLEKEHEHNKAMQATHRWAKRVLDNKKKKEKLERDKINKDNRREALIKNTNRRLERREKKKQEEEKNKGAVPELPPLISVDYVQGLLDEIDDVYFYWAGSINTWRDSSFVRGKLDKLRALSRELELQPRDEMNAILGKTGKNGKLIYEELLECIHLIQSYESGQDGEVASEIEKAFALLSDETINTTSSNSFKKASTLHPDLSNGLRTERVLIDEGIEDFL